MNFVKCTKEKKRWCKWWEKKLTEREKNKEKIAKKMKKLDKTQK